MQNPPPQLKQWQVLMMLPDDVLTLCAMHGKPDQELLVTALPPDVHIGHSQFASNLNLLAFYLESDFFDVIPGHFDGQQWQGDWPFSVFKIDSDPESPLAALTPDEGDDGDMAQKMAPTEPFDPTDYPPAPQLMDRLHDIFEKSEKLEFQLRAFTFDGAELLQILRGDEAFNWATPFGYPPDTEVLGTAELGDDKWVLWCTHPDFETCEVIFGDAVNAEGDRPVLIEIPGDGQKVQYRITLAGVTVQTGE